MNIPKKCDCGSDKLEIARGVYRIQLYCLDCSYGVNIDRFSPNQHLSSGHEVTIDAVVNRWNDRIDFHKMK